MSESIVWLLSSSGRRGALLRILQGTPVAAGSRVVAIDRSPLTAAGQLADSFHQVPAIGDLDFIPTVLEICRTEHVDVIVPTIDTELMIYAQNKEAFAEIGVTVLVSSPEVISLAADKLLFHNWLVDNGLPSVPTFPAIDLPNTAELGAVIAKPRGGSSSIGVIAADSLSELPLGSLSDDYIVQHKAEGQELTVDFAVHGDGSFLGCVPRRRLEVRSGEVSKGITVRNPAIEELARHLASRLPGAHGILNFQCFFQPETEELAIIELNGRVGGGFPLSHQAGATFFEALVCEAPMVCDDWLDSMLMLRFDDAVFVSDWMGAQ